MRIYNLDIVYFLFFFHSLVNPGRNNPFIVSKAPRCQDIRLQNIKACEHKGWQERKQGDREEAV